MIWKRVGSSLAVIVMSVPIALRAQEASLWLTTPDRESLLKLETPPLIFAAEATSGQVIDVDDKKKFQTIDGFGFALTGGSAQLIGKMDADKRAALLKELFTTDGDGIGVSYLRVSVGASDMNDHVYSYDDLPKGNRRQDGEVLAGAG